MDISLIGLIAGLCISLVGGVWLIVVAFRTSILWGLGVLFVPCVAVFFALFHWDRAGYPFLVCVAGTLISTLAERAMDLA